MKVPVWLLTAALLAGCSHAPPAPPAVPSARPSPSGPTIVAFGDSLTAGLGLDADAAYPAQLERRLADAGHPATVINAGSSGETSSGALSRVNWVLRMQPDLVLLETGANDGLRGVDPSVTRRNLTAIIEQLKAHHVRVILCGMRMVQNMGPSYTKAFAAVYPAVAQSEHVPLEPFFLEGVGGVPSLNQDDGLHPTAAGYRIVVEHLYPLVVTNLPNQELVR